MPLFKFIKEFCVCVCVVDNVLLSKDKTECFLCDFGLSEMLDRTGYSTKTFRGNTLHTYTHTLKLHSKATSNSTVCVFE